MQVYFFDFQIKGEVQEDVYGIELADRPEAVEQAEELAKALMSETPTGPGTTSIVVEVRSADGMLIHTVHNSFVSCPQGASTAAG